MRIEELSINRFGTLSPLTAAHLQSINHLEGEEGTDASGSLAAFLAFMLYGHKDRAYLRERAVASGTLLFSTEDGTRHALKRTLDEDGTETLEYERDGVSVRADGIIGEEIFGINAETFLSLVAFPQSASSSERLRELSQAILAPEVRNPRIKSAVTRIDEAASSLLRPNGRGGVIFELEKRAEELREEIASSNEACRRTTAIEASLSRARKKKEEAVENLDKLSELDRSYANLALIREYDDLHRIENDLDALKRDYDAFKSKNQVNGFLPTKSYAEEIGVLRRRVQESSRNYAEAEKALKSAEEALVINRKTEESIEHAERKHGDFSAARETAFLLSRRALQTSLLSVITLFLTAFFAVCALYFKDQNSAFSLAILFLAIASFASSFVLFLNRKHLSNALFILCHDYGTKTKAELFERLALLSTEVERKKQYTEALLAAEARCEDCAKDCIEALDALNAVAAKWARHVDATHVNEQLHALLDDLRAFFTEDTDYKMRIRRAEQAVTDARGKLSNRNELAVRALVSPAKRESLRRLEEDGRMEEVSRGIALYRRRISLLDEKITRLEAEKEEAGEKIGSPLDLFGQLNELEHRIASTRTLYNACLMARDALTASEDSLRARLAPTYREYLERASEMLVTDPSSAALRLTFLTLLCHEMPPVITDTDGAFSALCLERGAQLFRVGAPQGGESPSLLFSKNHTKGSLL